MLIKFIRDFQSAATGEQFYTKGQEADLPLGAQIVAEGAAEIVTIDARKGQAQPKEDVPPTPVKRGRH
jgi:hypothetical protein